jgi:hypothetical protein
MSRHTTAITLAAAALTLGTSGPALAMPAGPDPVSGSAPAALVVASDPGTSQDGDGLGTLTVVLLASGALVAGAAAGFGGARTSAGRARLQAN